MEKSRRKYSGAGISVRITKGITLRAGGGQSDPEEVFNTRSAGTLYFTNKRFIFHGSAKSTTIELSEIAQLPLGPDHFQVIRDNLPTEIFTFATHWLNSEKVRALVVRLWLSNAAGDSDEYITSEDSDWVEPDVEDATDALSQQSLEEIEALHGAIASEGVPTEADLSSFENLVNTVLAWDVLLEKKREYPHCLIDSSRSDLITRVFSAHEHRDISADFAKTILARLRASRRLVSPHVADFEILLNNDNNDNNDV